MTLKVHVIETTSDPVGAPNFVGQHWVNTSSGRQWLSYGVASVADWKENFTGAVLDEQVRDVIGAAVQDSASIDFTNNDVGDTMSLAVIPGGVNHDALLNFVANEHIDHSTVSISAGTGLTGGGDITANRTISMPNTGTAGTYRSVTTDAQGRVTAGTNPTTLAGYGITDAQPLDSDLTAVAGLAGTGLVTRTGTGTATTRTITAGTGISLSNGDGVSGNPTVTNSDTGSAAVTTHEAALDPHPQYLTSAEGNAAYQPLDSDLTAIAGQTGTGLLVRTGSGTATTRFIAVSTGLFGSAVDGVAGNPTIGIGNTGVTAATYGSATQVPQIAINAQGQASSASNVAIAIPSTQVTDFETAVRGTDLAGFSATPDSTVLNTDTLLAAIGKLQAQVDRLTVNENLWDERVKAADTIVSSNVTLTNITDLGIPVVAGSSYYLEYTLLFRTAATATGFAVSLNTSDTAVGEGSLIVNMPIAADGTAALYSGTINAFGDVVTGTGVQTAQPSWFICNMKGVFRCTTSGTLVPQFRSEVNGSNVNCGQGSTVLARRF